MSKSAYITLVVLLLFTCSCVAQDIDVKVRHIGGEGNERGESIVVHSNGSVYIVGTTGGAGTGNTDILVTSLNESLTCQWSNAYGGFNTDNGADIVECPNGDLILVGFTNEEGDYDGRVIRIQSSGEIVWDKVVGDNGWNFIRRIIRHPDGGYVCVGESNENPINGTDAWLLRIDEDGNILSTVNYGGEGYETFNDVFIHPNGFVLVVGAKSPDDDESMTRLWAMSLALNLEFQWEYVREDLISSEGVSISTHEEFIDLGGNYFDEHIVPMICRLNFDGTEVNTIFSDINSDYPLKRIQDLGFGFLLVGNQSAYGLGSVDAMIQQWSYPGSWMVGPTFGTPWTDEISDVFKKGDSGLYFAGTSFSETSEHDEDVMLVYWPTDSLQSQFDIETLSLNCSPVFQVNAEEIDNTQTYSYVWSGNSIRFANKEDWQDLYVYDLSGKCLLYRSTYRMSEELHFGYEAGIYFVRFRDSLGYHSIKVHALK